MRKWYFYCTFILYLVHTLLCLCFQLYNNRSDKTLFSFILDYWFLNSAGLKSVPQLTLTWQSINSVCLHCLYAHIFYTKYLHYYFHSCVWSSRLLTDNAWQSLVWVDEGQEDGRCVLYVITLNICSMDEFSTFTLVQKRIKLKNNNPELFLKMFLGPFELYFEGWQNRDRKRDRVTCSDEPQVGLEPWAAAGRTEPSDISHTVY